MKILILSSSAGNGHNSTANKIKNKVLLNHPDYQIEIIDIYKSYGSKFKSWTMSDGYLFACNHFVKIYNYFFKKSEKNDISTKDTNSANKDTYTLLSGILNKIYEFQPDLIISTYIFCTVALNNLKRFYNIPAKIFCMTLDYGISPYWESASCVDKMFLTDDYMIDAFLDKGYRKEQLVVSGIPVGEQFAVIIDKQKAREQLCLEQNLFTVLVMKSGFFGIKNYNLTKEFSKVNQKIQIVFVNGKNEKTKKDLNKQIKHFKLKHKIINLGFSDKIDLYLSAADVVLTKGGGLSTTEALNKLCPMLIVDNLPQQEIYNKKYLVDNGCALDINKNNSISKVINEILLNEVDLNKLKVNMQKLKKANALQTIITEIDKVPNAVYPENVITNNKKRIVIKNVEKERKKLVKKAKQNGK